MRNFPPPPKTSVYQLQKLRGRHHEIIRRHHMGMKNSEIAKELGITVLSVRNALESDLGRECIGELESAADNDAIDIAQEIAQTLPGSIALLRKVMEGDEKLDEVVLRDRINAAKDLLDRGGFGKIQRVRGSVSHEMTIGIERIKERARELGFIKNEAIDIDAEVMEV